MSALRRRALLAAPVLGERGGGVGQVSQLLWRAMRDEWGRRADVVTLLRNGHDTPGAGEKWRFGIEVAGRQVFERPDWVLFSHLGLARVARYVPARWSRPYAVFLHGIECWNPLPETDREVLRRASLRIANSALTARRAAASNPGIGEIAVCPLALPGSTAAGVSTTARDSRPTVLVVGRISRSERYKGHEPLIAAWPAIEAAVPGARLVIAGGGDDLERLRALAAKTSPAGIELTGFLSRAALEGRYAAASVFALPSRGEGFGVVYLEAMAAGLPCVGSVHDAASEVIVNGETGVLVDPDNREQLASSISALLADSNRAREMGDAGRTRLMHTFSYEQFRERLISLLRSAFATGPAGSSA